MTDRHRVALVTGAARGIGAATALRLAAEGYRVALVDSCAGADAAAVGHDVAGPSRTDLESCADACRGGGAPDVLAFAVDVTDADLLRRCVDVVVERWGRLDVVVAAAAVIDGGMPVWQTPAEVVERVMAIDAMGVWHTAVVTVPYLLASPEPAAARFVAVASAAGTRGLFRLGAYTMAKHAVVGLVRGLAADLVGTGVVACAVCPGSTRSPMLEATAQLYGLGSGTEFAQHQSIRRLLEPEELADVIAFCCSPAGVAFAGAVLPADGGFAG